MKRSTLALLGFLFIILVAVAALVVARQIDSGRRQAVLVGLITPPAADVPPTEPTVPAPTLAATALPSPVPTVEDTADSPLTAALDAAHNPDQHPATLPLTVIFDQPIANPPRRPLVFTPAVPGGFVWSADATAVTFNPQGSFRAGTTYIVTPIADLRGANGAAFEELPSWKLRVTAPPTVLYRRPVLGRGPDRGPAITLTFSGPMDPATVAAAVEPDVPLDLTWQDGKTLIIQPAELLLPGATYRFSIGREASDTAGVPLGEVYRFRYTPSPIIADVSGPTPTDPDAPLVIQFGYPMDRTAVKAALTVEPMVDAELLWYDDELLELVDPALLGNVAYTFSLSQDVADVDGEPLPVSAAEPVVYTSISPLIASAPQGNGVHPASLLRWTFDRPLDPVTTAAALSISPSTDGELTWEDPTTLLFRPAGGHWQPLTPYEITLDTGMTDALGRPVLGEPIVRDFTTSEARRLGDFGVGPQTQVLDADGRRAVQFQTSIKDSVAVSFDLLPVDQTGFLNRIVGEVASSWSEPAAPMADNGLTPAASWETVTLPADSNRWANPQETLLPADAPPGLYLLRLNDFPPAHLLLALSRMTLVAKLSADEMVVWVSDIPAVPAGADDGTTLGATTGGEAVPGAAVQVYAQNGRLLAGETTDDRGVARLALPPDAEPYVVFATDVSGDTTFSALTPEMQSVGQYYNWWGEPVASFEPPAFAVHVQTDRPIYRPGQTVAYKAILREDDDGPVSLPPVGTQAIVRLRDSRDNVVQTKFLATDEFGAVYDSFDVAEGAMLGTYAVEVEPIRPGGGSDPTTRQTFQVEEYRKPDFSVSLTPAAPEMVFGETISVTVDTHYLFGEPVAGAPVDVKRFQLYDFDYTGSGEDMAWVEDHERLPQATIDAMGRAVIEVPAVDYEINTGYFSRNPASWRMAIEVTVNDGSNQTVSASTVVTVHRAAEHVQLDMPAHFIEFGDEAPFTATLMTTVGGEPTPVAGRALRGTLRAWSHQTYEYSQVVADFEWTTDADGLVSAFLTPPAPGYYRLRLSGSDEGGRTYFTETYIYVLGAGESAFWESRSQGTLSVTADREVYAPGDTARLLISTPFAGPAMLTLERASVRRELPVYLTPPVTAVDLDILPEDAPNIFVTVIAWEPLVTVAPADAAGDSWLLSQSQADATLHTASVELSVPVTDKALSVTIVTDREVYAPRDDANVTVRVVDATGQPVRAQVALAMVDEAIFLLADDNTLPLYDAFYGPRPNRVLTRDALAPGRYLYESGFGGGGGDGATTPRSEFPDTGAWLPALITDENGEATVTIPLADSLTTWRLTARAVTAEDTQVGEAVHKFTTHQNIIVRPMPPRGLTVGDSLTLSAVVHNYGDEAADLVVTLETEGTALAVTEPVSQTISLEPGASRVVGWPVEAREAASTPLLVRAALPDGRGDAVALILDVRPLAVPINEYATGHVVNSGEISFDVPDDALPSSTVTLEVSRSAAGTLFNGLEYLTGFPYGCVEQTMSRALPNAVVSRAFNRLGVPPPAHTDLDELINVSAQKLYGFQHDDGGWGWWFDDDSQPYQTAWVLFGLATMAEAGHEIDPGVIERGAAYLHERLDTADPRIQSYMLYSLAVAGVLEPEDTAVALKLVETVDAAGDKLPAPLDAFSLAGLALALDAASEPEAAQTIMERLTATVEVNDEMAHWGTSGDGQYDRKVMASATRSTALALSAFLRLRPGSELEPLIVNYLMDRRRGDGWGTTNETAYAIIGLTDHLLGTGLGETTAAYSLLLNGELLAEGALDTDELRDVVEVPVDQLRPGANLVTLTADDGGRLYYTLDERYQAARESIEADGVVTVQRKYLQQDGTPLVGPVAPGDLVRVQITVRLPRDASYVVVEDPVPAGLEPLNERLNTTSHDGAPDYRDENYWQTYRWQDYGYNHKEIRDGRVSFFVTEMPIGESRFDYLARATQSGTFTALPAETWAMYEPQTWGRSESAVVTVE